MRVEFSLRRACWLRGLAGLLLILFGGAFAHGESFQVINSPSNAVSALVEGSDGNLYGTTYYGGHEDLGTIVRIAGGNDQGIFQFSGGDIGANPAAALFANTDGYLYGTTQYGGTNNAGIVFRVSTNGDLGVLYRLNGATDGSEPIAPLVAGANGALYGTASRGGAGGCGTVFQITTNGIFTVLHSFIGADGDNPGAALTVLSDGSVWGVTQYGGSDNQGTIFQIIAPGEPQLLFQSIFSFTGANGAIPQSALVQTPNHILYGTTTYGGTGFGSIFTMTTNGAFATLYNASGDNLGSNPSGGVVYAADGNLYGVASFGGTNGFGSLFECTTTGDMESIYDFDGQGDGAYPAVTLEQPAPGTFYGSTILGGVEGFGAIFQFVAANIGPLVSIGSSDGLALLSWNTIPGRAYQLQTKANLTQPNWNNVGSSNIAPSTTLSLTETIGALPSRFFRVVLLP
ncbi:MAG TPA: choice-of-anchor tandem repeat GloVer-containing protein [Verrucomicrobiae bacterium]|jgi:uncharacterized repeat protein (TIGR03803 family)|nr:choice-of-anchor tandem repeat GloVer-containing protein [Verrucomicrobiae bacterium]